LPSTAQTTAASAAKAHERIHQGDDPDWIDLGVYLRDVCEDMTGTLPGCRIEVTRSGGYQDYHRPGSADRPHCQ